MVEEVMRGPLPVKFPHEPERIQKAAELLVAMRRKEIMMEVRLPDEARPRNAHEAQLVNDLVRVLLDKPVFGWKYYCAAKLQEAPLITPIYDIWESPALLPADVSQHRWIEPEIGFRCLRDFPKREKKYSHEEVASGVEALPVFEMIGPRLRYQSHNHLRKHLLSADRGFDGAADGQASAGYVVGPARKDWRDFDFWKMRVTMKAGDEMLVDTVGGHPLVDPFLAAFVAINAVAEREDVLAGQLIATHSYSGFIPVPPNVPIISTFDGFESIQAVFEGPDA